MKQLTKLIEWLVSLFKKKELFIDETHVEPSTPIPSRKSLKRNKYKEKQKRLKAKSKIGLLIYDGRGNYVRDQGRWVRVVRQVKFR